MNYGTTKTSKTEEDGSSVTIIEDIHKGDIARTMKCVKVRQKISSSQQEMELFLDFALELQKKRANKKLTVDPKDPVTYPAFIWDFPKKDIDGSYFILKTWTEVL